MKHKFLLGLILVFVFLIMALGVWKLIPKKTKLNNDQAKISVVTSFYPLYFLVSEIGGDKVEVQNITPAGTEPHDYEPTARDIAEVQQSKLLILNGNKFEAWGEKIKEEVKGSGVKVVEAGEGLFVKDDPHVWLSPELAKKEVVVIATNLMAIDPTNAGYYWEKAKGLNLKLEQLQMEYGNGLTNCKKKEIVTSHEAFGYLAREFGLEQVAIAGLSTEEEPSTKQLAEVANLAKEKQIKYIFFESLVSPKLSETIAEEIGAKTLVLDPIEGISESNLAQGKNYITVMKENLTNLRTALECQ